MSRSPSGPPRWAQSLLDRVLPSGPAGSSVRADLEHEFEELRSRAGPGRARRWFVWEALKLAAYYGMDGLRLSARSEGGGVMEGPWRNVGLALRRLRRAPGFSAVAVLTVGLGIGANVAIFSLVDGVLLAPLPYHDAGRLVAIWEQNAQRMGETNVANPGNFAAWRDRAVSFEDMSAVSLGLSVTLSVGGEVEELWGQLTHPDFFQVLGLEAAVGRTFLRGAADTEGAEVVLSDRLWRSRFGGDPELVGRSVTVNGMAAVVAGILPPVHVLFGSGTDLWFSTPLDRGDQTNTGRWIMVVGRLADGASFAAAAAELDGVAAGLREEFPDFNAGWSVLPIPAVDQVVGDVRRPLWILFGSAVLLLLIACANVANLTLVRATARQKEMAVRTSLGASGRALAAQLLTESLVLAALGAALGLALGWAGLETLVRFLPEAFALPRLEQVGVNGTVLAYTVALTGLSSVLFGLLPAVRAARSGPAATLNAESRGPSRQSGRVRDALVVAEVAVSVTLLAGAALLGRSLWELVSVDTGIQAERVLAGRLNLSGERYGEGEPARIAFFDELMERLETAPGVEAAGGIGFLPLDGSGAATSFRRLDRAAPPPEEMPSAWIMNVTGHYFATMGIPLLQGRLLDERDRADAPRAVVVSREMVQRHFPGEDPLGTRLGVDWRGEEPWEIVGVVDDVRMAGPDEDVLPAIYMTYAQSPSFRWQQVVLRAGGEPAALASVLRGVVKEIDPGLGVGDIRQMDQVVAASTARPRVTAFLMATFAGLATLLSAVGLYGLLAYAVSRREREIGVRIAIGARPTDVVRMVVRQGSTLAVSGLVVGVAIALAGGRLLSSLLYGVRASDPASLGAAALFLLGVSVAACVVPAWRAARVAPAEALRGD